MPFPKGNKFGKGGKRPNSGPPKTSARELAGKYRAEAVDRLAFWMRSDNPQASVSASRALIDRSDGMSPQTVDIPPETLRMILVRSESAG